MRHAHESSESQSPKVLFAQMREGFLFLRPRYRIKATARRIAEQRQQFASLQSLDAATKHKLMPEMRRAFHRVARAQDIGLGLMLFLLVVGAAISVPTEIPVIGWIIERTHFDVPKASLAFSGGLGLFYFLVFPIARMGLKTLIAVYSATLTLFGIAVSAPLNLTVHFPVLINFVGGAALMGALLPLRLVLWRRMARQADAILILRLMELIAVIEENPSKWNELPFRAKLLSKLDAIAVLIKGDFRRLWGTRDPELSRWLGQYTTEVAFSIHCLGKWLISPRIDTRNCLIERVCHLFICIARADWDEIPRDPIVSVEPQQKWLTRALQIIRLTVTSIIPITILWLLNRFNVKLEDPIKTYLYAAASLWAAIAWIAAFDPLYSTKIEAIKSLIPFVGSSKK
jgi:hypothetical protein